MRVGESSVFTSDTDDFFMLILFISNKINTFVGEKDENNASASPYECSFICSLSPTTCANFTLTGFIRHVTRRTRHLIVTIHAIFRLICQDRTQRKTAYIGFVVKPGRRHFDQPGVLKKLVSQHSVTIL